jgi:hypothetical protein
MDLLPALFQSLSSWWWLLPVALVIGLARLPVVKGYVGELLVRVTAWFSLDKESYRRLHNVTLVTRDGTTQIDHVIVSPFGVFVIETKNMAGWIFGGEKQAQWTQRLYRKTFRFQNPLRQNYKHVKAVEEMLDVPPGTVHSVVAFMGDSVFKTPMPENVAHGIGYIRYIKRFTHPVFTTDQVQSFIDDLESGRLKPGLQTHREHVANLEKRADPGADRICPACGSAMIIRTVSRGNRAGQQFWGCTSYPKCRVMQELG